MDGQVDEEDRDEYGGDSQDEGAAPKKRRNKSKKSRRAASEDEASPGAVAHPSPSFAGSPLQRLSQMPLLPVLLLGALHAPVHKYPRSYMHALSPTHARTCRYS